VTIMPGPFGAPRVTVRPDVSECNLMPSRERPVTVAATAWPASWHTVTSIRTSGQTSITQTRATNPITPRTEASDAGVVVDTRRQRSSSQGMQPSLPTAQSRTDRPVSAGGRELNHPRQPGAHDLSVTLRCGQYRRIASPLRWHSRRIEGSAL